MLENLKKQRFYAWLRRKVDVLIKTKCNEVQWKQAWRISHDE